MGRILFTAVLSLVVVALFGATPAASAKTSVVSGSWTSIDTDGSNQTLDIAGSGNGSLAAQLFDDSATSACDGQPAMFVGRGQLDENELFVTGTLTCLPGGNPLRFRITLAFVYSPDTDTLTDEAGVTWHRA